MTVANGDLQYQELSSKRLYKVPPLSPDAQAFWDVREASRRARPPEAPATQSGPYTYSGYLIWMEVQRVLGYTWFTSFFGVSQLAPLAQHTDLAVWIGLQNVDDSPNYGQLVMQPVLEYEATVSTARYTCHDVLNSSAQGQIESGGDAHGGPPPVVTQPAGVWAAIRYFGCTKSWMIRFYEGTPSTGVRWARPRTKGLPLADPTGKTFGVMERADCVIEIPVPGGSGQGNNTVPPWNCGDIGITAVFGGLHLAHGVKNVPANWDVFVEQQGLQYGIQCGMTGTVVGPLLNPNAQVTLTINPFGP